MDVSALPPEEVATLVARILEERDPASVGLRRILRRKTVGGYDFPMRIPDAEQFSVPGKAKRVLSEDELRILHLERSVARLEAEAKTLTVRSREAIQTAYTKGYGEGRKAGLDTGRTEAAGEYQKKISAVQEKVASFLKSIEDEKRGMYANVDRVLLDVCRRMVKKILSVEPSIQPTVVLNVLRKALSYVVEKEKLVIRVAPADLETVQGCPAFYATAAERLKDITIEPDERIERGGCIIESNSGIVDAQLDVQMDALTEVIETSWQSIHASTDTREAGTA